MVIPLYQAPKPKSRRSLDLVASFNFADGVGVDTSPNNRTINAVAPTRHIPSLALATGSSAKPDQKDTIVFGGPGSFSLLAWISRSPGSTYTVASCAAAGQELTITIDDDYLAIRRTGVDHQGVAQQRFFVGRLSG